MSNNVTSGRILKIDGFLYYAGGHKIHDLKISMKAEDVEKMLQESQKQQESAGNENKTTIEQKGDYVVIGNVRLPINPNRRE